MELVEEISVAVTRHQHKACCTGAALDDVSANSDQGIGEAVLARLSSLGLVIVPREPSEAMKRAGEDACFCEVASPPGCTQPNDVYRAMIAACEKLPVVEIRGLEDS